MSKHIPPLKTKRKRSATNSNVIELLCGFGLELGYRVGKTSFITADDREKFLDLMDDYRELVSQLSRG